MRDRGSVILIILLVFLIAALSSIAYNLVFIKNNSSLNSSREISQSHLVDLALVKNDITLCGRASAYYSDQGDYGYNYSKGTAIEICKGMYYGIKGDQSGCQLLTDKSAVSHCDYYLRWYPKNKETCMMLWSSNKDSNSFCDRQVGACPFGKWSEYCKNNQLRLLY